MNIFGEMYKPDARDRAIFGDLYEPPYCFSHGEWHQIARISKADRDGDGYDVAIDESRMPARFFRIRPLPTANSVGEVKTPLAFLSTGSGDGAGSLALQIARAMSEGMIDFDAPERES